MSNLDIIAFDDDWQRPARTEEWIYHALRDIKQSSRYFQFLSFPWATLIDLQRRSKTKRAAKLNQSALELGPKKTLIRATICQHIWALDLLPLFKTLGVTDLFWPHATQQAPMIDGIRLHPFPLFPVRAYDGLSPRQDLPPRDVRNIHFNFVGAYDPAIYLTPVRQWILNLPRSDDYVIKQRSQWHYETAVYAQHIDQKPDQAKANEMEELNAAEYDTLLSRSIFTLCPSGSGPNSIRFWEALLFGSIPVLLSDSLRLPGPTDAWERAIVIIKETEVDVQKLPHILKAMAADSKFIAKKQNAMAELARTYLVESVSSLILPLTNSKNIALL